MNVLVIDDEKDIRENISNILSKNGFNPTLAGTVPDAKKLIHSHEWDMVISDIMIPHLGGFDLVDLVKEISAKTPVIVITGMDKEVLLSTRNPADVILTKPFTSAELLAAVEEVMDKKNKSVRD